LAASLQFGVGKQLIVFVRIISGSAFVIFRPAGTAFIDMKKTLLFIALIASLQLQAQENSVVTTYPQDYFRNPLGIPIILAGNFGECRSNHFHSGIDIKTNGKENLPVYAAAEGYISR
jgi:murein DD-endopeptidase MepM/ murein hydrolase activator NlpD